MNHPTTAIRSLAILAVLAAAASRAPDAAAQVPCDVPFEAYLTDLDNVPIDGRVDLELRFYDSATGGEVIDCRLFDEVSVSGGWIRLNVEACGAPVPEDGCGTMTFDEIMAAADDLFLGLALDGGAEMRPRVPTGAVPSARVAGVCEELRGFDPSSVVAEADFNALFDARYEASDPFAGLTCAEDAVLTWTGTAWDCIGLAAVATSGDFYDLIEVPPGLADGDDDTTYEAGEGLILADGVFSVDPSILEGSGTELPVCAVGQVLEQGADGWVCSDSFVRAPEEECGPGQCLTIIDGALECVTCGGGESEANGFPIVDAWGYTWDGVQRPLRPWAEARDDCEAAGGRLPTATELWRNNATSGVSSIAGTEATSELWTLIATHNATQHATIRLNNGAVAYRADTSNYAYRCVWPDFESEAFEGDYCVGAPGEGCRQIDNVWNVDTEDRPRLTWAAAVNECNFYNGSIPRMSEIQRLVQAGWENGSNVHHWTADAKYWYSSGWGLAKMRWSGDGEESWGYDSDDGYAGATSSYSFRCIGKSDPAIGVEPDTGCVGGECFEVAARRARIYADTVDRAPANYSDASETCRLLGGSLPDIGEFTELVHAGWSNGSGSRLWLSDPGNNRTSVYGYFSASWTGLTGQDTWGPDSSTMSIDAVTTSRAFRCVWHETFEDTVTSCDPDEYYTWDGTEYGCEAAVDGDPDGESNPSGLLLVDAWGNAWDLLQRTARTYPEAYDFCEAIGGRLPTPGELWRVRANQTLVDSIGESTSTSYLWTLAPDYRAGYRTQIRISNGAATAASESGSAEFRCVWPTSRSVIFGSQACYGEPEEPCFEAGRMRTDRYDRAAVSQPAAAWECAYYGGRLPDADEFLQMVRGGAPNGSNTHNWINDPVYVWSSTYGYVLGLWNDVDTSWIYTNSGSRGTYTTENAYRNFRCVYDDDLE